MTTSNSLCFPACTCFKAAINGGQFLDEVSWNLERNGAIVAAGAGTEESEFCTPCSTESVTEPELCRAGYYQDQDTDECAACPANSYRPTAGADSFDKCLSCPEEFELLLVLETLSRY